MIEQLEKVALKHGDKLSILPIEKIVDLKNDIVAFKEKTQLNNFQKWIVDNKYSYGIPDVDFEIKSVIILACKRPSSHANVKLTYKGKRYATKSLVPVNFNEVNDYINDFAAQNNCNFVVAHNLPLKRLATRSGLASYGRNNITYVKGLGSFLSYIAYYTDIPCDKDNWSEVTMSKACKNCNVCYDYCPTGAIIEDRFLINNEKCLSFLNETPKMFPDWVLVSAHHCIYDCMMCTHTCPMNKAYINKEPITIEFTEHETNMLLDEKIDKFDAKLREKVKYLGMDEWIDAIPRNIKIILDNYNLS